MCLCLYAQVSLWAYLKNHMSKLHPTFPTCCQWLLLDPHFDTLRVFGFVDDFNSGVHVLTGVGIVNRACTHRGKVGYIWLPCCSICSHHRHCPCVGYGISTRWKNMSRCRCLLLNFSVTLKTISCYKVSVHISCKFYINLDNVCTSMKHKAYIFSGYSVNFPSSLPQPMVEGIKQCWYPSFCPMLPS